MPLPRLDARDRLHVIVIGPGQGETIVVRAGAAWLVVDSCRVSPNKSAAQALLKAHSAHWSALLLTHKHSDHIEGFYELIDAPRGPIGCRLPPPPVPGQATPGVVKLGQKARKVARKIEEYWSRHPVTRWDLRHGLTTRQLDTGDVAHALIVDPLWPTPKTPYPKTSAGWNAISTPCLVRWRNARVLLGADLGDWSGISFLPPGNPLHDHDGLKVPHHGSAGDQPQAILGTGRSCGWAVTPYFKHGLPDLSTSGGAATLLDCNDRVLATSLVRHPGVARLTRASAEAAIASAWQSSGGYASAPVAAAKADDAWWHLVFDASGGLIAQKGGSRGVHLEA